MPDIPFPTPAQLTAARELYVKREPRYGAWDLARQVIEDANGGDRVTPAEAVAALLRTWNSAYYRTRPVQRDSIVGDLDALLGNHAGALGAYAERSVAGLGDEERGTVKDIFEAFRGALGSVGVAKAFGLLAPDFFPMWDTKIRRSYQCWTASPAGHAESYWRFMKVARDQIQGLGDHAPTRPLKRLDEYNYCRFSRGWL